MKRGHPSERKYFSKQLQVGDGTASQVNCLENASIALVLVDAYHKNRPGLKVVPAGERRKRCSLNASVKAASQPIKILPWYAASLC